MATRLVLVQLLRVQVLPPELWSRRLVAEDAALSRRKRRFKPGRDYFVSLRH